MRLNQVELLLGWLAVLVGAGLAAFTYYGGYIAPESVWRDLLVFGAILALIAVGVTADSLLGWFAGRLLLGVATLALLAIAAISFVSLLFLPALLALFATMLAFARPFANLAPQTLE